MNRYTLTIQLDNKDQFQHFVDEIGPLIGTVVLKVTHDAGIDEVQPAAASMHTMRAPRAPRVSKVNTAIINALRSGDKGVKELKQALEDARLSPGSLSTGLAQLQKAAQVERLGGGLYGLRNDVKEAAE
jgi:hypothetical protein